MRKDLEITSKVNDSLSQLSTVFTRIKTAWINAESILVILMLIQISKLKKFTISDNSILQQWEMIHNAYRVSLIRWFDSDNEDDLFTMTFLENQIMPIYYTLSKSFDAVVTANIMDTYRTFVSLYEQYHKLPAYDTIPGLGDKAWEIINHSKHIATVMHHSIAYPINKESISLRSNLASMFVFEIIDKSLLRLYIMYLEFIQRSMSIYASTRSSLSESLVKTLEFFGFPPELTSISYQDANGNKRDEATAKEVEGKIKIIEVKLSLISGVFETTKATYAADETWVMDIIKINPGFSTSAARYLAKYAPELLMDDDLTIAMTGEPVSMNIEPIKVQVDKFALLGRLNWAEQQGGEDKSFESRNTMMGSHGIVDINGSEINQYEKLDELQFGAQTRPNELMIYTFPKDALNADIFKNGAPTSANAPHLPTFELNSDILEYNDEVQN